MTLRPELLKMVEAANARALHFAAVPSSTVLNDLAEIGFATATKSQLRRIVLRAAERDAKGEDQYE